MSAKKIAKKTSKKAGKKEVTPTNRSPGGLSAESSDSPDTDVETAGKDGAVDSNVSEASRPGTSTSSADSSGSPKYGNPPDRKDVIQLAAQLVSAQIAAYSHHEAVTTLFNEFRQTALDVADTLRRNPPPLSDSNSVLDAVADSMNSERLTRLRSRKPRALQPMSHPDLDRLFQSAMRRAFVMLNAPFDGERIVFAEQIFSHSDRLPEGAIRKRFIEYKWPRLGSADSVIKLMNDVNRWFSRHLDDLQASHQSFDGKESISAVNPEIPIATRIEAEAAKLLWLLEQISRSNSIASDTLTSYRTLESALLKFTNSRNGFDFGGAFTSLDASNRNNLIYAMFCGNGPRNVDAMAAGHDEDGVSKDSDIEDSPSRRRYRPWAIFRYLRRHCREAEDELSKKLYGLLCARRSELSPAGVPDIPGIEPAEFEFGPLHQEVDDLLDELDSEGGNSDSATNSDEVELHGLAPYGIGSAGSEVDSNNLRSDDRIPLF
jgi:hypothetical protein